MTIRSTHLRRGLHGVVSAIWSPAFNLEVIERERRFRIETERLWVCSLFPRGEARGPASRLHHRRLDVIDRGIISAEGSHAAIEPIVAAMRDGRIAIDLW